MQHTNIPRSQTRGQIIKEYRKQQNITQEELAYRIGIDTRTLRSWEKDGVVNMRQANKKMLSQALGILPELLDLPSSDSSVDIESSLLQAKSLLDAGAFRSALSTSQALEDKVTELVKRGNTGLRGSLNLTQYLTGHAISIVYNDPQQARYHYQLMSKCAWEFADQFNFRIARTYEAEMSRRMGKHDEALQIMKSVLDIPKNAHLSATERIMRGNSLQLLARIHIDREEVYAAIKALKQAEEMLEGYSIERNGPFYICFNQCSLEIEYAKAYARFGVFAKSLHHIKNAYAFSSIAPRWSIPTKIAHADMLIRLAISAEPDNAKTIKNEQDYYQAGLRKLSEGYTDAKKHDHRRQMEQVEKMARKYARSGELALKIAYSIEKVINQVNHDIARENNGEI